MFRSTKIICTLGPATWSYPEIEKLIDAGMNVARINFSHGTHERHRETIENVKKAREAKGVPVAIMLDTKGPEIRLGMVEGGSFAVAKDDLLEIHSEVFEGKDHKVTIDPPVALKALQKGMSVLIDDGYIQTTVEAVQDGYAVLRIKNKGLIKSQKGVNIPYAQLDIPAMTEKDKEDLAFGCEMDVDIVAASFIRSPEHVMEIKNLLLSHGKNDIWVFSKIESALGVEHFDAILQVSDGIMVARGDLGVELPLEQVPKLQKMMIRKTYHAFKPVITATQMLESMIQNPLPTRAEASDVANAIYDNTSAVMLSGETAIGEYPIDAVKLMAKIVDEAEKDYDYKELFYQEMSRLNFHDISSAVAHAAVKTAYSSGASSLFAFTSSGHTAKAMSRFRPDMPILALTQSVKTYNQMAISWGIIPINQKVEGLIQGIDVVSCYALNNEYVHYGDLVVIAAGSPFGIEGTTNTMLVDTIGEVLVRGDPRKGKTVHGFTKIVLSQEDGVDVKGKIVVLAQCSAEYEKVLKEAAGIIVQNHPEDELSEKNAVTIAARYKIPIILGAEGATSLLEEGMEVTMEPKKGLVFKGIMESDDIIKSKVCRLKK